MSVPPDTFMYLCEQVLQLLPLAQLLLTSSVQPIMDRSWGLHLHSVQHHGTALTVRHCREETVWLTMQKQQQPQQKRRRHVAGSWEGEEGADRDREGDPRTRGGLQRGGGSGGGGGGESEEESMEDGDDGMGADDKDGEEIEGEGDQAQLIRLLRSHSLLGML